MTDGVVVALDVGGTDIKGALVGPGGVVRHRARRATGAGRGQPAVVASILDFAGTLAGRARAGGWTARAAGVVVPGVVDEELGVAVKAANVPLASVPLRDLVADRLEVPAALGHDVRGGALAEARLGAGRDADHVLFVPVGTGIAAAYVAGGAVLAGAGAAGELGHVVVRPGGPRCGCGARGCLEAVASAAAIARRAGRPAPEVVARAAAGDPAAAAVWRDAVEALADGLLTVQALLDPQVVVLGGGLSRAGEALLGPLRAALRERLTFQREPRIVGAALGDEAGCLGAGLLALALGP
ncbi:ROK family protein [Phytohabitans kaempferiae]|uniref:ROK family protein n=1 Tax=Phytohabitans kaempferiae TaxID=1620943 RepID=A0ABV6LZR9_9ACTN